MLEWVWWWVSASHKTLSLLLQVDGGHSATSVSHRVLDFFGWDACHFTQRELEGIGNPTVQLLCSEPFAGRAKSRREVLVLPFDEPIVVAFRFGLDLFHRHVYLMREVEPIVLDLVLGCLAARGYPSCLPRPAPRYGMELHGKHLLQVLLCQLLFLKHTVTRSLHSFSNNSANTFYSEMQRHACEPNY